ncbi:MAG TPA: glycogen/starch synthase, partial [Bacteroidales bacterium]|nr:glycogen/starch synthase [Bacteroidales bacterium]
MRVLMFGWEFPPHISGGLGTACYGLTKALLRQGVEVIFVVPKAFGDEDNEIRIVNASDFEINLQDQSTVELWKRLKYIQVASKIIPYISPEYYTKEYEKLINEEITKNEFFKQKYQFSGKYGPNLMYEVSRYALIASALAATNDFDVIHAHDWLTYPAGIAAKNTSGKPLVVHVHATEFDRSGENINQDVYNIEREGMMQADKVITV